VAQLQLKFNDEVYSPQAVRTVQTNEQTDRQIQIQYDKYNENEANRED